VRSGVVPGLLNTRENAPSSISTRTGTRPRKTLGAALAQAKAIDEEDFATLRLRMRDAEIASGELHGYAVALLEAADQKSERSARKVIHLERQLAAVAS
jgi:hypothetical protein